MPVSALLRVSSAIAGHGASAAMRIWREQPRIDFVIAENPVVNGRDWQERGVAQEELSAPGIYLGLIWWWMKQDSGYEISVKETDISDPYGWAMVDKENHFLTIACGGDEINNPHLAELKDLGGNWLVLDCGESSLYENNQEAVYSAVKNLLAVDEPAAEE